jgi:hypothetical protein
VEGFLAQPLKEAGFMNVNFTEVNLQRLGAAAAAATGSASAEID